MKFLVAAVLVACIITVHCLSEEEREKVKKLKQECLDENAGMDKTVVEKWKKGDFVEDEKVHKFMKCFGLKLGFIKEDGSFDVAVIKKKMMGKFEKSDEVVDKCTEKDEMDGIKNAVNLAKCVMKATDNADIFH